MKSFVFIILPLISACGPVSISSGGVPRDPIPQGTIRFTGNFVGQNIGQTFKDVQGVVSIYRGACSGSSCQWTVRIAGLLTPQELPLLLIPTTTPSVSPVSYSLRTYQGDQNYVFTAPASTTWGNLRIHSQPLVRDYGTASLVQSSH